MTNLEHLLELIAGIVEDDSLRWTEKRERIVSAALKNDRWDTSLEEFLSWFEGGE